MLGKAARSSGGVPLQSLTLTVWLTFPVCVSSNRAQDETRFETGAWMVATAVVRQELIGG
jgi:hypothetical protein